MQIGKAVVKKNHLIKVLVSLLTFVGAPTSTLAGSEDLFVEGAWARASIGTSRPGAAYMTIRNAGDTPVTIVGLATPIALMSEIHETRTNAEGVSSMSSAGEITIEPGQNVALEPGGLHAMLMRLQAPMQEGESFPLTLKFDNGSTVEIVVPILGIAARGPSE